MPGRRKIINDDLRAAYAKAWRELRLKEGLTQKQFAALFGNAKTTLIVQTEGGYRGPSSITWLLLLVLQEVQSRTSLKNFLTTHVPPLYNREGRRELVIDPALHGAKWDNLRANEGLNWNQFQKLLTGGKRLDSIEKAAKGERGPSAMSWTLVCVLSTLQIDISLKEYIPQILMGTPRN